MSDVFFIFAGCLLLNGLILLPADRWADHAARHRALALVAGGALIAALLTGGNESLGIGLAVPAQGSRFLRLFAAVLIVVAIQPVAAGWPHGSALPTRLRRWMPLLAANTAVLIFVTLTANLAFRTALVFCAVASLATLAIGAATTPVRKRLQASEVPAALRGAPIESLTCAFVALAAMGLPGRWP